MDVLYAIIELHIDQRRNYIYEQLSFYFQWRFLSTGVFSLTTSVI